jgi:formylglycine-generating enzyme required for sulfatase activity
VNNVGSESPKGDGKYGQADLAGNVYQWNLDSYGAYAVPCQDCTNLGGSTRVIAGAAFSISLRIWFPPTATPLRPSAVTSARGARESVSARGLHCNLPLRPLQCPKANPRVGPT